MSTRIFQSFNHFSVFLNHFVLAKSATNSIIIMMAKYWGDRKGEGNPNILN